MRTLIVLTAVALAATVPNAMAQQTGAVDVNRAQSSAQPAPGAFTPQLAVTSAEDLTGRPVMTSDNRRAGELAFVMIDMHSGAVPYAIIGGDGDLDLGGRYVALPWQAVKPVSFEGVGTGEWAETDVPVYVDATLDKIQKAQRHGLDDLYLLVDVDRLADAYGYWGYDPYVGWGPYGYGVARSAYGYGARPVPVVGDRGVLLVSPYGYSALTRGPSTATSVRGTQVLLPNGEEAEIDHVMIDPQRGRVAYALLSVGGFLGIGDELVPVPVQALQPTVYGGDYRFVLDARRLASLPVIPDEPTPYRVATADLGNLYAMYGVDPYWN